jgi:hypothetical protein
VFEPAQAYLRYKPGAESGFVGLEVYKNLGVLFKGKIDLQDYEYKIRYENEYFCRVRKEITKNYNFKKAGK